MMGYGNSYHSILVTIVFFFAGKLLLFFIERISPISINRKCRATTKFHQQVAPSEEQKQNKFEM
jgi:hypothetical protein